MKSHVAGPDYRASEGDIIDLEPAIAAGLIDAGYADPVEPEVTVAAPAELAVAAPAETAIAKAPEKAVKSKPKARRAKS